VFTTTAAVPLDHNRSCWLRIARGAEHSSVKFSLAVMMEIQIQCRGAD